MDMTEHKKCFI